MTIKLKIAVVMLFLTAVNTYAQDINNSSTNTDEDTPIDYQDTWQSPYILDEMTLDPEQNRSWRMGDYKFSAKPKHSWEFGLHLGHFMIDGDVDKNILGGYGLGLHLRKALNYTVSVRASLFYGQATGMETQPSRHRNNTGAGGVGGGLVESTFDMYDPMRGGPGEWFPAYMTNYIAGDISAIINFGNLLFHRERNKWNFYLGLGFGLDTHEARLDLLDSNGLPYDGIRQLVGWTPEEFDTKSGRDRIKSELIDIYDGDYETEGYKKAGIFRIGDEMNVHLVFIPTIGISRKVNKRFNISLEHSVYISDNDYLDGIKFRTALDQTNNVDVGHYTNVRIGFNIGNFQKVTEPLYWMNPIDQAYNDIANLKNQDDLDFSDEDNDGVIDLLDQEPDTPEDCPVDTRGVILDSDGDGIVDCEDREPYSRPGCPVDANGIAQCEEDATVNEEQLNAIMDTRLEEFRDEIPDLVESYASKYVNNTVLENEDGSRSYSELNQDGSKTDMTENPDGSLESVTNYEDGTSTKVTRSANDEIQAEITDTDGSKTILTENADGSSLSVTENPDGSVTRTRVASDGRVESETEYLDGSKTNVVKNTDGSIMSERENPDGSVTMTSKLSDGTIRSHTKYIDGTSVRVDRDKEGNTVRTKKTLDGVVRTSSLNADGDLETRIERPDGPRTRITQQKDGSIITTTDHSDGSYAKTTQKSNGEVLYEALDAKGVLTNIKQRADGTQRVVKSDENTILSDVELTKEQAYGLDITTGIEEITVPEEPRLPKVYEMPEVKEIPKDAEIKRTEKIATNRPVTIVNSACGDWFLPMIHYNLNSFTIKPQYYSHLHNVAQVMRKCPDVCVVAQGHTDTRHTNEYNMILSYRRAKAAVDYLTDTYDIDRSRIKLMYGGEDSPMVLSASSEAHHFMNRRVEFRTCETGDADMTAPEGYDELLKRQAEIKEQKAAASKGNKASGY